MTTAQISRIAPPPSVEAVLGALTEETRIGQVDFSSRLTDPEAHDTEAHDTEAHDTEAEEAVEATPVVAADTAAEELAEDPEDDVDLIESEYGEDHTAEIHTLVVPPPAVETADEPAAAGSSVTKPKRRRAKKPAPVEPEETVEVDTVEVAVVEVAVAEAPVEDIEDVEEIEEIEVTGPQQRPILPEPLDMAALLDASEGVDERPPSIEEIARLVVERMHDAELAMMRHLEAVEVETARRAELATAQAELDAELIRLNARREAHSIITAARRRAGQDVEVDPAEAELAEVAESLTRFADVMDELLPAARPGRPS